MSGALGALADLEKESTKKTPNTRGTNVSRANSTRSTRSTRSTGYPKPNPAYIKPRAPAPLPPPNNLLNTPIIPNPRNGYAGSTRTVGSQGGASGRRISFAEEMPAPPKLGFRLPTKTDSLKSGFIYDPRLNKYMVSEDEWNEFSNELVEAADVPGASWTWRFHRKDVIKRMRKELQYSGELKRVLNIWNKEFKRKGFQAWFELPVEKDKEDPAYDPWAKGDEKKKMEQDAKRFRIAIMPSEKKTASVYSRSSSLTKAVTGEGANMQAKLAAMALESEQNSETVAAQNDQTG